MLAGKNKQGRNNSSIYHTHQSQITNGSIIDESSSNCLEEIYSYVQQNESNQGWRRNNAKPIFAEESFPTVKRQQNPLAMALRQQNSQIPIQIKLDLYNPQKSNREQPPTGVFNSHTSYSLLHGNDLGLSYRI